MEQLHLYWFIRLNFLFFQELAQFVYLFLALFVCESPDSNTFYVENNFPLNVHNVHGRHSTLSNRQEGDVILEKYFPHQPVPPPPAYNNNNILKKSFNLHALSWRNVPMLTFGNSSASSLWLGVKHERMGESLIQAGGAVALGGSTPLSLVCSLAGFLQNWSTPTLWGNFKLNK